MLRSAAGIILGITAGIAVVSAGGSSDPGASGESLEDKAAFVGSESCRNCHPRRWETYQQTSHSRSLRPVDSDWTPRTGSFHHVGSRTSFEATLRDGTLTHAGRFHLVSPGGALTDSDPTIDLGRHEVRWVMGSGTFAEAYLMKTDDTWIQSPVTWYAAPDELAIAPGYERADHSMMAREVNMDCFVCHAGMVEPDESNRVRNIVEPAIGCERCHGGGGPHVRFHRDHRPAERPDPSSTDASDTTMIGDDVVSPADLSREANESICAQCHLHGELAVHASGADSWSFRPGDRLDAHRVNYALSGEGKKTFSGHFPQMWASRCYLGSETMTCTTCHDPHHGRIEDAAAYHRQSCVRCHPGDDDCGVPMPDRLTSNDNSCFECHMPKSNSEVAHAAVTDHRILRSPDPAGDPPRRTLTGNPRRLRSPSFVTDPTPEQALEDLLARAGGMIGHFADAPTATASEHRDVYRELRAHGDRSPPDPRVGVTLASLAIRIADRYEFDPRRRNRLYERAARDARAVLDHPRSTAIQHVDATATSAAAYHALGRHREASAAYRRLVRRRRSPDDHYNWALCVAAVGDLTGAQQSLIRALSINPAYAPAYQSLARLYQRQNPSASRRLFDLHRILTTTAASRVPDR